MMTPPPASPIDPSAIVRLDAQRVDAMREELGDELFDEILETLFIRSEIDLAACQQAHGAGDAPALKSAAHSMKGALLSLGFEAAAAIADRVQLGQSVDVDHDLNTLSAVMGEIRRTHRKG